MNRLIPLVMVLLSACTTVSPATRLIPSGAEPEQLDSGFDRAAIERDLLLTARNRVGENAIRRALASESYIFAKYYPGMMPPPPPGLPHDWRPKFPFVLLFKEQGRWVAATAEGVRPVSGATVAKLDSILAQDAFWQQPNATPPQCTDAGASILLIKLPARPETLRRGSCGATEMTQRLVAAALES